MQKIRESFRVADDIVELLTKKFANVDPSTIKILQIAAASGATFSFGVISAALSMSLRAIVPKMNEAMGMGIISPLTPWASRLLESMEEEILEKLLQIDTLRFRWVHDRMQQAAYETVSEADVPSIHLTIGSILLKQLMERYPNYSPDLDISCLDVTERLAILDIADHFAKVSSRQDVMKQLPSTRRDQISSVMFQAGSLAFQASSMDAAQNLFVATISSLGEEAWGRLHSSGSIDFGKLCFEAHLKGFIAATLNNDDAACKRILDVARKNVKDKECLAKLLMEEALRRTFREPKTSMQACRESLKAMDLGFIGNPSLLVVVRYVLK
ncbi:hypothetical protein HDU67_003149 [Dinochytrium kinnereticum]|nr:hypothetical protein HDU67_003149 [Dinochytrium kinnereticum]